MQETGIFVKYVAQDKADKAELTCVIPHLSVHLLFAQ
jgi:hypothetical protein